MGLGLLTGRSKPGQTVDGNYHKVQELIEIFKDRFGSTNCKELTGVHLGTPEGQTEFREKNQIKKCLEYAEEATRIVLSLVKEED